MASQAIEVGVVVERRPAVTGWVEHVWLPVAVLAAAPEAAPWTVLAEDSGTTRFYAGAAELEFHSSETAFYRDNLNSGRPSLWVGLRPADTPPGVALARITADPAEGEAMTETGTDIVEALPMPPPVAARLAAFVAEHHVERPFLKRRRDEADPTGLGPRRRREAGE